MQNKSRKSIILIVFTALFFGTSILCEKVYAGTVEQNTIPASPEASEENILCEEIQQLVMDLEYSETVAGDFANMVMGWKNKQDEPHLIIWKRQLLESRDEYSQEKIDIDILARNEIIKAQELSQKILYTIEYEKEISDLDEVILNEKANCLGFTQTFYILANSIGLKTKAIDVLETAAYELKSDEEKNKGHIACLVYLVDDKNIMVDLAQDPVPMVSKPFDLQKEYKQNGLYWERKNNNYYYLYTHKKIRIIDSNGIVSIVYFNRCAKDFESNKIDKVISNLSRAIELNSKFDLAYLYRGITYRKTGEYFKAINDFAKYIEFNSQDAGAYNIRGLTYSDLGKYIEAISDYNKAIELVPKYVLAYNNRANAYTHLEQYDQAISDCNIAIELDPNLPDAYYNRGNIYYELNQYIKALSDYNKAIELNPKVTQMYYNRGILYDDLGQYHKAISDFNEAIKNDPNFAVAYSYRGSAYAELGKFEEAKKDLLKAVEIDPELKDEIKDFSDRLELNLKLD
jgi:tetratricopeptide (TPR) repeat protein